MLLSGDPVRIDGIADSATGCIEHLEYKGRRMGEDYRWLFGSEIGRVCFHEENGSPYILGTPKEMVSKAARHYAGQPSSHRQTHHMSIQLLVCFCHCGPLQTYAWQVNGLQGDLRRLGEIQAQSPRTLNAISC